MIRWLIAISLVTSAGCKKAADLSKYQDRAKALAAKYAPKLGELSKKLPELAAHAKDLPVNVPGADQVNKLLADNKSSLEQAQDILAKLPAQIGADKDPAEAEKQLAEAEKALSADVAKAEADEKEEAEDLAKIDAQRAAAGSAAAGSGSGSAK